MGPGATTSGTPCPAGNGKIVELRALSSTEYTIFVSGCPQYSPFNQTTPNTPSYQNLTVTFRRTPVLTPNVTYIARTLTSNASNPGSLLGPIGIALNGVPIYNDADGEQRDAYIYEGSSFDGCRGHAGAAGAYHYHSEPGQGCVYNDTAGRHSPLFGIMLDSVPIFGALGDGGVPPTNLDECGGHVDTSYPFYHYHVTHNLAAPYTIKCLKGCIFSNSGNSGIASSSVKTDATCVKAATQYNYTALSNPFIALPVSAVSPPPPPSSSPGAAVACRWTALASALPLLLAVALALIGSRL